MNILELKDCFIPTNIGMSSSGSFLRFLATSNHPDILKVKEEKRNSLTVSDPSIINKCKEIEESVLYQILEALLREPESDHYWYSYPENGSKFYYSLPHHDVVPSDSLRVDKEKIKIFLRNWKLEKIGI